MASLKQASTTRLKFVRQDGWAVYALTVDGTWSVFGTPHGGYLLACLTDACSRYQASPEARVPTHRDAANILATFLQPTKVGEAEVHVRGYKSSKSWSNVEAKLVQGGETIITAQYLYTALPPLPLERTAPAPDKPLLLPGSKSAFAPVAPFLSHPSALKCKPLTEDEGMRRWTKNSVFFFKDRVRWAEDKRMWEERLRKGKGSGEKLEWGMYFEMKDDDDEITGDMLPFFADLFSSIPELLPPPDECIAASWFPTMTIQVDIKCSPAALRSHPYFQSSPRTVALYGTGPGNLILAGGRHVQDVQVWTSPTPIGKGEEDKDWRQRAMLLCTSSQLALAIPRTKIQARNKAKDKAKL